MVVANLVVQVDIIPFGTINRIVIELDDPVPRLPVAITANARWLHRSDDAILRYYLHWI